MITWKPLKEYPYLYLVSSDFRVKTCRTENEREIKVYTDTYGRKYCNPSVNSRRERIYISECSYTIKHNESFRHRLSKLSEKEREQVINLLGKKTQKEIAKKFNISQQRVSAIKKSYEAV